MSWLFQEPPPDPKLGALLRSVENETRSGDLEPLRQRILAAARPKLAELRSPAPHWWDWLSRWMPVAVPVGLAAVFAAVLALPGAPELSGNNGTTEVASDSSLVMAAFAEPPAGGQLAASLIAPEGTEWLWQAAVAP